MLEIFVKALYICPCLRETYLDVPLMHLYNLLLRIALLRS